MNERLEALSAVEEFQAERGRLEQALAWAPALALRAGLETNRAMAEETGPESLRRARSYPRFDLFVLTRGEVLLHVPAWLRTQQRMRRDVV